MSIPVGHLDVEDPIDQIVGHNSPRRSPRIAAKSTSASSTPTSEPEDNPAAHIQPQKLDLNEFPSDDAPQEDDA